MHAVRTEIHLFGQSGQGGHGHFATLICVSKRMHTCVSIPVAGQGAMMLLMCLHLLTDPRRHSTNHRANLGQMTLIGTLFAVAASSHAVDTYPYGQGGRGHFQLSRIRSALKFELISQ
jgi:hypothetical protein